VVPPAALFWWESSHARDDVEEVPVPGGEGVELRLLSPVLTYQTVRDGNDTVHQPAVVEVPGAQFQSDPAV
jgi:hypothetical protein